MKQAKIRNLLQYILIVTPLVNTIVYLVQKDRKIFAVDFSSSKAAAFLLLLPLLSLTLHLGPNGYGYVTLAFSLFFKFRCAKYFTSVILKAGNYFL